VTATTSKTKSAILFRSSAEDLAQRLASLSTPDGIAWRREALELAAAFTDWEREKPTDEVRVSTIQRLFELNRRVMDYFSRSR
jgi:hypothetical protein